MRSMLSFLTKALPSVFRVTSAGGLGVTFAGALIGISILFGGWTYGKAKFEAWADQYQLKKECDAIQDTARSRINSLNEARQNDQDLRDAVQSPSPDAYADWLERMQQQGD